jgi:hypothetical protein
MRRRESGQRSVGAGCRVAERLSHESIFKNYLIKSTGSEQPAGAISNYTLKIVSIALV